MAKVCDAITSLEVCAYRGTNGRSCAVGCLIADEHYSPALENQNAGSPIVQDALLKSGVDAYDSLTRDMLMELQGMHDGMSPSRWAARFDQIANNFGV